VNEDRLAEVEAYGAKPLVKGNSNEGRPRVGRARNAEGN
jgi:hypothetical protein